MALLLNSATSPSSLRLSSRKPVSNRFTAKAHATTPRRTRKSGAVAYTRWLLDGVNCAGVRSDDLDLLRFKDDTHVPMHCPVNPVDITSLCQVRVEYVLA